MRYSVRAMQFFTNLFKPQLSSSSNESGISSADVKKLAEQTWITHLIVLIGMGYLILIPSGVIKKKLEPVDVGILTALILTNSGIITRITSLTIGKDGLEAKIEERVKDTEEKVEELKRMQEKYDLEQESNLRLLKEVDFHLSGTILHSSDYKTLLDLMKQSSPTILEYVYQKAKDFRHRISDDKRSAQLRGESYTKKGEIERTIDIFRALIDSNHREKCHRFHAQLGYALKDQERPNWAEAKQQLDEAIEKWKEDNPDLKFDLPSYYCFNWLVCIVEIADRNGFKIEYSSTQQDTIRDRIEAAVKCPQLIDALTRGEHNVFKNTFAQWCEKQSSWLDVNAIIRSSRLNCRREADHVESRLSQIEAARQTETASMSSFT